MKQLPEASLKNYNSFSVAANCQRLFVLDNLQDLSLLSSMPLHNPLMLGGGSNILFITDYPGDVILNRLQGRQIIDATDKHAYVRIQAGSNWHESVLWSLEQGLSGIENLALIPGTAGAAPIQNIGAYGVEIKDSLELVEVWDRQHNEMRMLKNQDCMFAYRDSLFRQQPERFWITNITLKLYKKPKLKLGYTGLKQKLETMGCHAPRPVDVANAVSELRLQKLPEPKVLANAGSFFKNPIIKNAQLERLLVDYPQLPHWPQEAGFSKVSAAWMIQDCGWKGHRVGDVGVSPAHALILINFGCASGAQLWQLANDIQQTVKLKFNLQLIPEPRIIQAE